MKEGLGGLKDWVEMDGAETAERASSLWFSPSGSRSLDELLGGGYRAGRVVEVFGKSNSGKTQIAMQAALYSSIKGRRTLFIDTEGSFRPERIAEIAAARGLTKSVVLESIVYLRATTMAEQEEAVMRAAERELTSECELVIVDSLTKNFTLELPGNANLANRQGALGVHLSRMARDAIVNERAYLVTNRVTFGSRSEVEIGGKTVDQLVHGSLWLERSGGSLRATDTRTGKIASLSLGIAGVE
ncbi:MAG: AAA family ATPase [archaeon]|nr:MAG: AAA family ATPase [archaeon]